MTKRVSFFSLLVLAISFTAILTGCGSKAAVYRVAGIHNDATLQAAQSEYNKARQEAATKLAETAKAGGEMLDIAKQMQANPQDQTVSK
jgi:hypothetical protein